MDFICWDIRLSSTIKRLITVLLQGLGTKDVSTMFNYSLLTCRREIHLISSRRLVNMDYVWVGNEFKSRFFFCSRLPKMQIQELPTGLHFQRLTAKKRCREKHLSKEDTRHCLVAVRHNVKSSRHEHPGSETIHNRNMS